MAQQRSLARELRAYPRHEVIPGVLASDVIENAAPVLLATETAGVPAEVEDGRGAVRDRLPGPQPDLTQVVGGGIHGRTRLLFEHPIRTPLFVAARGGVQQA
jgi:hypothetical protein